MFVAAREWFGKRVHAAVNGSGITRIDAGRVTYNANHIIIDCAGTSKLNTAIVSAKYTVAVLTTRLRHSAMDAKRSNAFANASAVKVTSLDVILNFSSGTTPLAFTFACALGFFFSAFGFFFGRTWGTLMNSDSDGDLVSGALNRYRNRLSDLI